MRDRMLAGQEYKANDPDLIADGRRAAAVTIGVFALGGIALAARVPAGIAAAPGRTVRVLIGLGCLALAVLPVQAPTLTATP